VPVNLITRMPSKAPRSLFHVEQFLPNGKALGEVCYICLVFLDLDLRLIYRFCVLLQRMGILGCRQCVWRGGLVISTLDSDERVKGGDSHL
jgi:hypothetical protein